MDTAAPSEIGLDEFLAVANLFGGAFEQCLALHEDVDAIADLEDETNIVVNEQDTESAVTQFSDPIGELADLALIEPGGRLIEQDVRRVACQGSCDANKSFNAVRQRASRMRSAFPETKGI